MVKIREDKNEQLDWKRRTGKEDLLVYWRNLVGWASNATTDKQPRTNKRDTYNNNVELWCKLLIKTAKYVQ